MLKCSDADNCSEEFRAYAKKMEIVVGGIMDIMADHLEPGPEEINAIACVITNVLSRHFQSCDEAAEALNIFNKSVAAVMAHADEFHLTSWVDDEATLN